MYNYYSKMLNEVNSLPMVWAIRSRIQKDLTLTDKELVSLKVEIGSIERRILKGKLVASDNRPWYVKLFSR